MNQTYIHKFPQTTSIGAGNVVSPNLNNFNQLSLIKLPFPPTIRASDIAKKRLRSKITSKSPNAFFIYRKAFVDQLSNFKKNNKLKMTEVSRLVSSRWKMESKQVKVAYEEIAKQVEQELNDIRNKDLVYTDDFDIGKRRKKNHKRGRRSNSEFGIDPFFLNLKGGNFNISTLDFSVKPSNNNDNNNNNSKITHCDSDSDSNSNSNPNSKSDPPSLPSSYETLNIEYKNNEENVITFENYNDDNNNVNNDNVSTQQLQQNDYNEFTSPISESELSGFDSFELICDDNLLTPNYDGEIELYNDYNDYNNNYIFHHQNDFNLFLKNNENSTPDYSTCISYPTFEDRGLDYYLDCFDNLP